MTLDLHGHFTKVCTLDAFSIRRWVFTGVLDRMSPWETWTDPVSQSQGTRTGPARGALFSLGLQRKKAKISGGKRQPEAGPKPEENKI